MKSVTNLFKKVLKNGNHGKEKKEEEIKKEKKEKINFKPKFPTLLIAFSLFFLLFSNQVKAETIYPYWIDENLDVWTKVNLTANSQLTLYITKEYGYSPNGEEVFDWYDDFSSNTLSNYNIYCSDYGGGCNPSSDVTISNGKLHIHWHDNGYRVVTKSQITRYDIVIESYGQETPNIHPNGGYQFGFCEDESCSGNQILGRRTSWQNEYRYFGFAEKYNGNMYYYPSSTETDTNWHNVKLILYDNGKKMKIIVDGNTLKDESLTGQHNYKKYLVVASGGSDAYSNDIYVDYIIVRKYVPVEPSVTITDKGSYYEVVIQNNMAQDLTDYQIKLDGSQLGISSQSESLKITESINQAPTISIISPQNTTYYTTSLQLKFKAYDDNSSTFWVKAYFENQLIYENTSYQNNTEITLNLQSYITEAKTYYVKVWANDTDSRNPQTSEETVYFTIEDYEIEAINYNPTVYETSDQSFKEIIRVNWDLISNISANFYWNSTDKGLANYQSNSTHIILTKQITIPLIQQNNTQVSFYFKNNITYTNGTTTEVNSDSNNQNITYAYWISDITSDKQNYIEGETSTIKLTVINILNKASLSTKLYLNGEEKRGSILEQYPTSKVYSNSFYINSVNSSLSETRNYWGILNVSFQGNSRIMESENKTLTAYRIFLTQCNSTYSTQTLKIILKDEETRSEVNGSIDAQLTVRSLYGTYNRTYAWEFRDNTEFSICIYPSWAIYKADGTFQYWATNYPDRNYFLVNATLTNTSQDLTFYLLDDSYATEVLIYVKDPDENPVEGVIVKARRYFIGQNSYITVAMTKTDWEGKGLTFLRINEIWYSFVLEKDGQILREYPPAIVTCLSTPCTVTLYTSPQEGSVIWKFFGKIQYSCSVNDTTKTIRCTVDDPTNLMTETKLTVQKLKAISFETVCESYGYSSSNTLVCDFEDNTTGIYKYSLDATVYGIKYHLESDTVDWGREAIWGSAGLLLTFFIAGTLGFLAVANPVASILFALLGLIISFALQLYVVSIGSLIGLIIGVIFLVVKMRS